MSATGTAENFNGGREQLSDGGRISADLTPVSKIAARATSFAAIKLLQNPAAPTLQGYIRAHRPQSASGAHEALCCQQRCTSTLVESATKSEARLLLLLYQAFLS